MPSAALAGFCFTLLSLGLVHGQFGRDPGPDKTLTAEQRSEVIEGALKSLDSSYVFPDVAKKMAETIRQRVEKKEYDSITSARALCKRLTADLQEVSRDLHLRVGYSSKPLPKRQSREPSPKERDKMRRFAARRNFGFEKVERLAGNIGYLDLRGFMPPHLAGDTAAAAMNFLTNTDALVIDLRHNGGGDPAMVALLSTYLFPEGNTVHLNDLYFRPNDSTRQWWTLPYVPGKRYAGKPVYVLTSKNTFSAAEEFTYNLKNLKRATIVGETTGGGAHPGGPRPINDHFFVWVPSGRAINPISKTNWEGTGVKPDIDVPADLALKTAHVGALKKLKEAATEDGEWAKELGEAIDKAERELKKDTVITPDLSRINEAKSWSVINGESENAKEDGKSVLRLKPKGGNLPKGSNVGLALVEGADFAEGTIDIDLKGKGEREASFVGVAFNVADGKTFEAVYFRPFNFKRDNAMFRARAVQYVAWPDHTWENLRKGKPGKYESAVKPVPDPGGWFHARVEVTKKKVRVWVDDAKEPCLVVDRLADREKGKVGLFVDSKEGAFRNLRIRPAA
jgi:hypothetical protein